MIYELEEIVRDQDIVLNDLEELGGKEFLLKNQYNTKIFSLFPPPLAMLFFHLSSDQ